MLIPNIVSFNSAMHFKRFALHDSTIFMEKSSLCSEMTLHVCAVLCLSLTSKALICEELARLYIIVGMMIIFASINNW